MAALQGPQQAGENGLRMIFTKSQAVKVSSLYMFLKIRVKNMIALAPDLSVYLMAMMVV